ncbi:MAG TPA: putative ABC exporter domain-containing protein [Verrucomicrobiae bacterium]|nr:putative ABC exporter domain-containing protein [Verrucomicrobiae bacterium]
MDASLWKLIRLRMRGAIRHSLRGLKTVRGLLRFVFACGMMVAIVAPALIARVSEERMVDPHTMRTVVPTLLLVMFLLAVVNSGGDKAVYFSPGEVNFLFGGPFHRRELLIYKLVFGVISAAIGAVFFSMLCLTYFRSWLAAYVGIFLSLVLMQFLGTSCLMIAQSIGEGVYSRWRKIVLAAVVICLVPLAARSFLASGGDLAGLLPSFRESLAGRIVLAVFDVYGRAMTAERVYPDLLEWASVALVIDCVLAAFVIWLDADYVEAAIAHSQKRYERLQRMRRGGFAGAAGYKARKPRASRCPWLGGAGPIAWRQMIGAARGSRALLFLLLIVSAIAVPAFVLFRGDDSVGGVIMIMCWMAVFLTQRVTFDFRGDLDHMDVIKGLPLRPTCVVLGELVTPVLVLTALQLLIGLAAVATGRMPAYMLGVGTVAVVPINFLLCEIENLLFLLFPSRQMTGQPTDFQFFGRTMLMFAAKTMILLMAALLVAAVGFVVYVIVGDMWIVVIGVAASVLVAITVALIPCLAYAFRRFDISTETPP